MNRLIQGTRAIVPAHAGHRAAIVERMEPRAQRARVTSPRKDPVDVSDRPVRGDRAAVPSWAIDVW